MVDLKWKQAYETLTYDTPSGDLGRAEYVWWKDTRFSVEPKVIVRQHPVNNHNPIVVLARSVDLAFMTEVQILPGHSYYHEYVMPGERIFRERFKESEDYFGGNLNRTRRSLTDAEIADAVKDDDLWR